MAKKRRMRKAKYFANLETPAVTETVEAVVEPTPVVTEVVETIEEAVDNVETITKEKASTENNKSSKSRKTNRK